MAKRSAGLLIFRERGDRAEVFLVHPGGPFWAKKDAGSWTIPKGEIEPEEEPLAAATREFKEETGFACQGEFLDLGSVVQPGGKTVLAWAFRGDCDPSHLKSNTCRIEWPPRSGCTLEIPEVDRGGWFSWDEAQRRIFANQRPLLDRLREKLAESS